MNKGILLIIYLILGVFPSVGIYFVAGEMGFMPEVRVMMANGVATIWLTVGLILVYWRVAGALSRQTEITNEQTTVFQEAEWLPEAYHEFGSRRLLFKNKRPWYPEFHLIMEDDISRDGWVHQNVGGIDPTPYAKWVVKFPEKLTNCFGDLPRGKHKGNLYFIFESMTGKVYLFIYKFEIRISPYLTNHEPSNYVITEVPSTERILPWGEPNPKEKIEKDDLPVPERLKN